MKIAALRLFNVKRFANRGVAIENIGDGVNVLCAVNEFGKSTSFEALHALFFQPHSSTAGDVRNLRPYSGGNPLVEADIETAAGRYRITKQFYGRGSARVVDLANGRLVAQADEAEAFIAGLVRGGTAGPAGLLWVRQGVTGIERKSRSEEDGEKQVRASLLESVQGEVEAVTGGRRMAEILSATQEALLKLVTPTGRPKTGERYALAVEERDRLETEERRLAAEVESLRGALDRRAAASRRLAELDSADERHERLRAVSAAEVGFDAARAQGEALRAAEAELLLTREQTGSVERELAALRTAKERAVALKSRLELAQKARLDALARRDAVGAAVAAALKESDAAEGEEQETRALLLRLDAALKARDGAERLAELERKLEAAETARRDIENGEAALSLLRLPDKTVAELEMLDGEISKLKAVAEAGRPTVSIAYEPQAPVVSLNGSPLGEGEVRSHDGQARLDIPGIGIVTLRSSLPRDGDQRLRQSLDRSRVLLEAIGLDGLPAVRARLAEVQRRDGELRELRARLSVHAPDGLPRLREETAKRREAAGEAIEVDEDPIAVRAAHEAASARRQAARQTLRETEPLQASATDAFVATQAAMAKLDAEWSEICAVLGPEDQRAGRDRVLADRQATLNLRLSQQNAQIERLRTSAVELAAAEATLRRVRSVAEAADREIGRLREEIAGFTAEIRARSDEAVEEQWRETADALGAARARVAAYEKEVAVLQRLRAALEDARSAARDLYLKPVMSELRPLLGLLFDDVSISFDEKTLLPHKILRGGQEEEVERLSGGMREQLSVLTRLAFARLLASDGRPAPVILDDALVYSDDDRIEKMFNALHRQARDQQIIVFSCRQRAFQRLGGTVLRMVDWQPEA